ncbi:MAG TPA: VRR-NUC domain-containing protein [Streptosporangiaceae bacterium]|nr:VRR-NUC domain-containing protein [Streptosporangiaceae bacterium]
MTEDRGRDSLDAHVRRLVADLGLLRYHTHDARRSPKGFPDLVLAGPGGVLFRELKTQRGQPTPEQQQWLDALAAANADVDIWRPADLLSRRIARELANIALVQPGGAA